MESNGNVKWVAYISSIIAICVILSTILFSFDSKISAVDLKVEGYRAERLIQFSEIRERLVRIEEQVIQGTKERTDILKKVR